MRHAWLAFVLSLAACSTAARPAAEPAPAFDGMALYRSGRMHELRDQLRARLRSPASSRDEAARDAILLARTYIDLRVVWDEGSLDDAFAVLAAARPSDPKLVAELEQATGETMFWRKLTTNEGAWDEIRARFDKAIELRTAARDSRGVAESTFYRGLIAQFVADAAEAQRWWERAVELGKDLDDPLLRSYPIRHLADLAETAGDLTRAEALHREALTLRERDGDVLRLFNARLTLATFLCERLRNCPASKPQIEAARRTADELRMPHGKIEVAVLDAQVAEWHGDLPARDAAWQRALDLATKIGDRDTAAIIHTTRAAARLRARDHAGALADARTAATPDAHAIIVEAALLAKDERTAETALEAAWKDAPAQPSARMYLAAAAWLEARGARGAVIQALLARSKLAADPRAWRDAALVAARAARDPRAELDVLVSYGDPAHLEEARRLAGTKHLPLH